MEQYCTIWPYREERAPVGGLKKYIRPYYALMLATMFIKFLGALVELMIPNLLETILDDVVPTGNRGNILLYGGGGAVRPGLRDGQ